MKTTTKPQQESQPAPVEQPQEPRLAGPVPPRLADSAPGTCPCCMRATVLPGETFCPACP